MILHTYHIREKHPDGATVYICLRCGRAILHQPGKEPPVVVLIDGNRDVTHMLDQDQPEPERDWLEPFRDTVEILLREK